MKKLLIGLTLLGSFVGSTYAGTIMDQVSGAFVGRAKLAYEVTTSGLNQVEFLDNVFEIGNLKGAPLVGVDFGVLGNIVPASGSFSGADFTAGGKLHLSPIIKNYVTLPAEWQFINNLEIDTRYSYNFRARHAVLGICAAYPWR